MPPWPERRMEMDAMTNVRMAVAGTRNTHLNTDLVKCTQAKHTKKDLQ